MTSVVLAYTHTRIYSANTGTHARTHVRTHAMPPKRRNLWSVASPSDRSVVPSPSLSLFSFHKKGNDRERVGYYGIGVRRGGDPPLDARCTLHRQVTMPTAIDRAKTLNKTHAVRRGRYLPLQLQSRRTNHILSSRLGQLFFPITHVPYHGAPPVQNSNYHATGKSLSHECTERTTHPESKRQTKKSTEPFLRPSSTSGKPISKTPSPPQRPGYHKPRPAPLVVIPAACVDTHRPHHDGATCDVLCSRLCRSRRS